jgi:hypothetical protein
VTGTHRDLIFSELPQLVNLPSHFAPVPFWVVPNMGADLELGVAAVDVSKLVGVYLTEAHAHECAEVYMALSPRRGDMVFEITLDDETYVVESPLVVYVPAGVRHRFKTLKAEHAGSYFYGILLDMAKA